MSSNLRNIAKQTGLVPIQLLCGIHVYSVRMLSLLYATRWRLGCNDIQVPHTIAPDSAAPVTLKYLRTPPAPVLAGMA